MNVIDSSHMEAVKNWLEDNSDHELRIKRFPKHWGMMLIRADSDEATKSVDGNTFGGAISRLSNWVGQQPRKT